MSSPIYQIAPLQWQKSVFGGMETASVFGVLTAENRTDAKLQETKYQAKLAEALKPVSTRAPSLDIVKDYGDFLEIFVGEGLPSLLIDKDKYAATSKRFRAIRVYRTMLPAQIGSHQSLAAQIFTGKTYPANGDHFDLRAVNRVAAPVKPLTPRFPRKHK